MRLHSEFTGRQPDGPKVTIPAGEELPEWAEKMLAGREGLKVVDEPKPKKTVKKKDQDDGES